MYSQMEYCLSHVWKSFQEKNIEPTLLYIYKHDNNYVKTLILVVALR